MGYLCNLFLFLIASIISAKEKNLAYNPYEKNLARQFSHNICPTKQDQQILYEYLYGNNQSWSTSMIIIQGTLQNTALYSKLQYVAFLKSSTLIDLSIKALVQEKYNVDCTTSQVNKFGNESLTVVVTCKTELLSTSSEFHVEIYDDSHRFQASMIMCPIQSNRIVRKITVCSSPLVNVHQLESLTPGLLEKWITHHTVLMKLEHLFIYDVDGSAASYIHRFIDLNLVTYYSHNISNTKTFNQYALSLYAENHCIWSNRGMSDWVFMIPSLEQFYIDQKESSNHLFELLSELEHFDNRYSSIRINNNQAFEEIDGKNTISLKYLNSYPSTSNTTTGSAILLDPNNIANVYNTELDIYYYVSTDSESYKTFDKGFIYDYNYLTHANSRNKEDTFDVYIQSLVSELWNYSFDLISTMHKLFIRDDFSDFTYTLSKGNPDILLTHNSNQLRIALIGPGCHFIKIPPVGWGAVEAVVWNYYIELTHLGHVVQIFNTNNISTFEDDINFFQPDVVHYHGDRLLNQIPLICHTVGIIYITNHGGYLDQPLKWGNEFKTNFEETFSTALITPNVYISALSYKIADIYRSYGMSSDRIFVHRNGVDSYGFSFTKEPMYHEISICVGRIEDRKRQHLLQNIFGTDGAEIVFVGNPDSTNFQYETDSYLGEWSREQLRERLTQFGNLVLLTTAETAAPLVVMEGLTAGLGLVVTSHAITNLNISKPFIHVIPDEKLNDYKYIRQIIRMNKKISLTMREEIRKYGMTFDWKYQMGQYVAVSNYLLRTRLHSDL